MVEVAINSLRTWALARDATQYSIVSTSLCYYDVIVPIPELFLPVMKILQMGKWVQERNDLENAQGHLISQV